MLRLKAMLRSTMAAARKRWGPLGLVGVILGSVLAVALGSFLPWGTSQAHTRAFTLQASQFAYSPYRLSVNKGDKVILTLEPKDVSHGLYIDGYGLETHASPTKEGKLEFVADKPGTFRFRCSITCGNLHPFMIGELTVERNTPFAGAVVATLLVAVGAVGYGWWRRSNHGSSI